MFDDVQKVKRYTYEVIVHYEIYGKPYGYLFAKPKRYKVSVSHRHYHEYSDMNLENSQDEKVQHFQEYLNKHYSDPETIAKENIHAHTLFKDKPIFYTHTDIFAESESYIIDSVNDVKFIDTEIVVNDSEDVHNLTLETLKKELTIDEFIQVVKNCYDICTKEGDIITKC